ncbi:DUF4214 domain-containing protein [Vreelandella maris]|uniref:DUF4214 domain-containing protein n=1 Tax=Vreelandella maris TaxID=2729617 RepID=UPI0030EF1A6A
MALTVTEIQQLYTAYLGRPVDQEGLDYWTDAELDLNVADLRFNLANDNQPEYVERYGNLSREELVAEIYQNMFNRAPEAEGLAYWTTGEGSVVPANELQQLFIEAASEADRTKFDELVAADEEAIGTDTSELTEALNGYQDAVAAEDSALEAVATFYLEDDAPEAEVTAAKDTASSMTRDQLLATAKADVVAEEKAVQQAEANLAGARAITSDAELAQAVTDAQKLVNNDADARTAQANLQDAKGEVADHVADTGTDKAVAADLYDAIVAFNEEGGNNTGTAFTDFLTAYEAEIKKAEDVQNFAKNVLASDEGPGDLQDFVTVDGNGKATLSLDLSGATADLRTAVRDAAKVAGVRESLNATVVSAENAFKGAGADIVTGLGTAGTATVDLGSFDFTTNEQSETITFAVDGGSSVTVAGDYADIDGLVSAINTDSTSDVTASKDGTNLVLTSGTTGTGSSVDITNLVGSATADTDISGTATEVTGSAGSTVKPGEVLISAQGAVSDREDKIDAVTKAEEELTEAHRTSGKLLRCQGRHLRGTRRSGRAVRYRRPG